LHAIGENGAGRSKKPLTTGSRLGKFSRWNGITSQPDPKVPMKPPKSDPVSTQLDPSHPNYDAILLKRARLEAHRRRRRENRGEEPPLSRVPEKAGLSKPRGANGRKAR
jgi:hypothetical protein